MRLILVMGASVALLACGDDSGGGGTNPPPVKYDQGTVTKDGPLPQPDAGVIQQDGQVLPVDQGVAPDSSIPSGNSCYPLDGIYLCKPGTICNLLECGLKVTGTCVSFPSVCPSIWAPVCGCDGTTFQNDCYRVRAGVSFWHTGSCEPGTSPFP